MNLPGYRPECRASKAELLRVLELIREAKKPMIYAGGGIIASGAALFSSRLPNERAFRWR